MKWSIITDSSCDVKFDKKELGEVAYARVPFTISVGDTEYVDGESLDVLEMISDIEKCPEASHTACPSPSQWEQLFLQSDNTIAITISQKLSGSYNSAMVARDMVLEQYPDKKIYVMNSKSAGSALAMYVEKILELIHEYDDFDTVVENLQQYSNQRRTIFALSSFYNLIKNGRMNKIVGSLAGVLGIIGIGVASEAGEIFVKGKVRGVKKVISHLIDDMKEHNFAGGTVVISHCDNAELAESLKEGIQKIWQGAKVKIISTGGLCSYYAERKGLILAY